MGYHSNPTRLCVLTTQIHSQIESQDVVKLPPKPCLYSRALQLQIQTIQNTKNKEKYENGEEYATLNIKLIGCPKLRISTCHSSGGITTR